MLAINWRWLSNSNNGNYCPRPARRLRQVTIIPAISTPMLIDIKSYLNFKPRMVAAKEPVQAPVAGSGMATSNTRPIRLYLSITLLRCLVRSNSQYNIRLKHPILLSTLEVLPKNNRISGTGNRFPMMANRRA
jgi:hypothetical protein